MLPVVGLLSDYLSGKRAAKDMRKAAKEFINYQNDQRNLFLDQSESQGIREKLGQYVTGNVGYSPDVLQSMQSGVYEDYGKTLRDMNRNIGKSGVMPGGGYAPGRRDRTQRILGENLGVKRAESLRAIKKENADVALDNQRWATSVLPTYLPGLPATPAIPYQVFRDKNQGGPSLAELGGSAFDAARMAALGFWSPQSAEAVQGQANKDSANYGASSFGRYY